MSPQHFMSMLWLIAAVMCGPVAQAAEPSAVEKAEAAYAEGVTAFKAGEFKQALARFQHAYLLDNSPVLLYNIARACEELGRGGEAIYYFGLYLDRQPDAEDRPEVERRVAALKASGATATAGPPLQPGGEQTGEQTGEPTTEPTDEPTSEPADGPTPGAETGVGAEVPPARSTSALTWWGWGLTAGGGVGLALGAVWGLQVSGYEEDHRAAGATPAERSKAREDGEAAADRSTVAWVAGGLLAAGGVALLIIEAWSDESEGEGPTTGFAPAPGGLVWSAQW